MFKLFHKWKTRYMLWHYNRTLKYNCLLIREYLIEMYEEDDEKKCWKIIYTHLLHCIRVIYSILLHGGLDAQLSALKWKKLKDKIISYHYSHSLCPERDTLESLVSEVEELLNHHSASLVCLKTQEGCSPHS